MENKILKNKNILLFLEEKAQNSKEFQYLIKNFCGIVVKNIDEIQKISDENYSQIKIYVCGNIEKLDISLISNFSVNIIKEFSYNDEFFPNKNFNVVPLGKVPVLVENVGVYFRNFFEGEDFFDKIKNEHEFQSLTESNRPSQALRKGIYLSPITKKQNTDNNESLHFYLLRCSSNLSGATDNFRATDHHIINELYDAMDFVFEQKPPLNHVLAQIYENSKKNLINPKIGENPKESKAKIKAHSDKTKDMPQNGIIAFCTFYEKSNFVHLAPSKIDKFDWVDKNKIDKDITGLTKLYFKLKNNVQDENLAKEFSVTLYPNSVFIIPLSTNRLYTHEIRPSILNVDKIPTRLGYVVRCSKTEAIFVDEKTYIKENENIIPLQPITEETLAELRSSYLEENKTEKFIEYGKVHFSMNLGDYLKPMY